MTDDLRARIARAAHAIAHDFKTDEPGDADLILLDAEQLLDAVERIVDEHIHHLAGQPIETLGLDVRYYNPLARLGIRTLEQLAGHTRDDLLAARGLGATALAHIQTALAAQGLALADPNAAAAGPADFFQAHRTYIQAQPFTPPEALTVFRCTAVDRFPGTDGLAGELIAFGFATPAHPGDHWSVYLCRTAVWAEGWTEYDEAATGGENS